MKKNIIFLIILIFISCTKSEEEAPFKLIATDLLTAKEKISSGKNLFVEVGAKSCYSCQLMSKTIEKIKNEKNKDFNVIFVDVYESPNAANEFKVTGIPMQLVFDESGKEVFRHLGVLESEQILQLINQYRIY